MDVVVSEQEITIRIKRLTATIHTAAIASLLAFLLLTIALLTPNWIEGDRRLYNNAFDKLGLWTFCFRSFTDPQRRYPQYFASCRWFFDYDWRFMQDVLAPPFFILVQFTYAFGYTILVITMIILALFWTKAYQKHDVHFLQILSFLHAGAGFWFFIAYTTFGVRAYDPTWLPGWHNNYLSWSFGLAIVGGLLLFLCSFLYYSEGQRVKGAQGERRRASDERRPLTRSERPPAPRTSTGPRQSLVM